MSSYLNNLLTQTTSRYNSLRRTLLSDEADGDTEDDTHISRVLRAYYTEKGRPFPPWLPPDPKAPQQAPSSFVSSSGRQPGQQAMGMGRGGGLSDLWDTPQQVPAQETSSLRAGARGRGGPRRPGMVESLSPEPQSQGRPLPSQRVGSYQTASSFSRPPADPSPPPSSGSGSTAQERLKARLWGSGRSNSPVQSAASSTSTSSGPTRTPYERSNSGPAAGGQASYPDDYSGGYSGRSGGGRPEAAPRMSANSPWSGGGDDPYGGGGGYGGRAPQRSGGGRMGLPSGPRMRS